MDVSIHVLRGLNDAIRTGDQDLRDTFFNWLLIFTGVVVAGVFLEIVEFLELIGVLSTTEATTTSPNNHSRLTWIKVVPWIGWLLIFVGVAGEAVFEGLVAQADNVIQAFNNVELIGAEQDATDAETRAAIAIGQVGDAREVLRKQGAVLESQGRLITTERENAARFQKQATESEATLKNAQKELDETTRRRGLRSKLLANIGNDPRLAPFVGQRVYVFGCGPPPATANSLAPMDEEVTTATSTLRGELYRVAHWNLTGGIVECGAGSIYFSGVGVMITPRATEKTKEAAAALVRVLADALLTPNNPSLSTVDFAVPSKAVSHPEITDPDETVLVRIDRHPVL